MQMFRKRRRTKLGFLVPFLLSFLVLLFNASALPCDDNRCETGSCDDTGACICNLPDPSTILDGDRPFFGGRFCDEEQIMCDGTNSFWCGHGASCEEIVQGENYTCKCLAGYTGLHCENAGAPCGRIFCFHEAECLVEGDVCECPPDWRGSVDCSLPTRTVTDTITNSTTTRLKQVDGKNTKWVAVFLAISCSLAAVSGVVIYAKRFFKKKETMVPKFQQLSQMQTHDLLDDNEDDSSVPEVVLNDGSHL